eukprot:365023-Chlamydomonas_euryale.AAC.11
MEGHDLKANSQFAYRVKMTGAAVKSGLMTRSSRPPCQNPSHSVILTGIPTRTTALLGRGGVATRCDDSRHRGIQPICELAIRPEGYNLEAPASNSCRCVWSRRADSHVPAGSHSEAPAGGMPA